MVDVVEAMPPAVAQRYGDGARHLTLFAELLVAEGELRGLIGPRELPRLWSRHLLNSAAVSEFVPESSSLIDVGSGAGFPGIVVATIRPDVQVRLIEPMQRRVDWLHHVVSSLGLSNVEIYRGRADEFHGGLSAPVVTARAVAALGKLVSWCGPLVDRGGALVALKGRRASEEVATSQSALKKAGFGEVVVRDVEVLGDESPATVVVARRR